MKIAVTDAYIFIDLYELGLIASFFNLELEIHTTSAVYNDLYNEQQQILKAYQSVNRLILHNLKEEDFIQIYSEPYPRALSETDKSVLYIANKLNAYVLSSDKAVRNCAKNKDIECHGMIWIFDRLIEANILAKKDAVNKIKQFVISNSILQSNKSLVDEIQKRLKLWQ